MICVLSTCNVYYEGLEREENVREVPYILCKYHNDDDNDDDNDC